MNEEQHSLGAELAEDHAAAYGWRDEPAVITCSGGFRLPPLSVLLGRKAQEDAE